MKYSIYIPKSVFKSLRKIPLPWQERIRKAIDLLEIEPSYGEKLFGKLKDKRKIRIWPYRVIYEIDKGKKIIIIVEVDNRQGIYK